MKVRHKLCSNETEELKSRPRLRRLKDLALDRGKPVPLKQPKKIPGAHSLIPNPLRLTAISSDQQACSFIHSSSRDIAAPRRNQPTGLKPGGQILHLTL